MTINQFVSGVNTSFSTQLNTNFVTAFRQPCRNLIRQLQNRTVTLQEYEFGEAYTSAGGRLSTVDTGETTATFSTNKYTPATDAEVTIVHDLPLVSFPDNTTILNAVPMVIDWEDGADIQVRLRRTSIPDPKVFIEATNLDIPALEINDCKVVPNGSGKWIMFATSGDTEQRFAKIAQTLFYGTNGSNPRVLNITGLTALKTTYADAIGKRAYFGQSTHSTHPGSAGTVTYRFRANFNDTTTNTDCMAWGISSGFSGASVSIEMPEGTPLTNLGFGVDVDPNKQDNPDRIRCNASWNSGTVNNQGAFFRILTLCVGTVSFDNTGTSGSMGPSNITTDFTGTHSVPLFTDGSAEPFETFTSDWRSIGKNGDAVNFGSNAVAPTQLDVKLIRRETDPTSGFPSIAGIAAIR